ncbi:MAG TPA: cytochrome d ubiquinol oxidase subunit II [Phycisphaerae bacterium]|nr:cytochrome d ubiquinol oxidase subunit II [Phycisphaerae bacterium]
MILQIIWFVLIGILFAGFAILDGFDFGVGMLHLFARSDNDRRVLLNSIGPVWDGNEVWLVTGGGALFAAFKDVYATLFSGFYLVLMLLLLALIFRAVSIEFRSKEPMKWWRTLWDINFFIGSLLAALLLGAFVGNLGHGITLDANGDYTGLFWDLLNPYALMVGITTVALFMMHGAIYLVMKTDGELHDRVRGWVNNAIIFFIICAVTTTMVTELYEPHLTQPFKNHPVLFIFPMLMMLAIANIPREIHHKRDFQAFLSSCAAIVLLLIVLSIGMFPTIVYATNNPAYSLTVYNSSSSQYTLRVMLVIACIGMPLVLGYTTYIYYIFRHKVRLDSHSY